MAVLRCSACVRDISAREGGGVPCPLPRNKKLLWMRRPPPAEMSGLLVRAHASRAQSSHPQLPIYPSPLEVLCPAWRAVGKVGRRGCCTSPQNVRKPAPELTIASTYSRSISSVSSSRQSPRVGGGAAAIAYAWVGGSTPALSRCRGSHEQTMLAMVKSQRRPSYPPFWSGLAFPMRLLAAPDIY